MARATSKIRFGGRSTALVLLVAWGFGLRAVAAFVVQEYSRRKGTLCVFPDTGIYWVLAGKILAGAPYEVPQWEWPHYALRTPGYPIFLAACRWLFGESLLAVRLVQAGLGAGSVWLVERIVPSGSPRPGFDVPMVAAALVATEPYTVGISALVLSEALLIPLMLGMLWGLSILWPSRGGDLRYRPGVALAAGLVAGAAILVRPSWALFVPAVLLVWIAATRERRRVAVRGALLVGLGVVVIMAPWWVRNARVFGRFVPTALWVGASLYDGLNPRATGASDMDFLALPEIRAMDESTQDNALRARGLAFARENPGRVLRLAAIKAARFLSPWPNAETLQAPGVGWASALVTLPIYALILLGIWDRRGDLRALTLLAGPLLYFLVLHLIFVSSIRYRIPGAAPALGLAAIGAGRLRGAFATIRATRSN